MAGPTNIRWRILLLICLGSFVSYTLRANISTAAPFMLEDLGLSEIQWGWVIAAFTASYALFQFPGGIYGDTAGPKRAMITIAVWWGVLTLATALVPSQAIASTTMILACLVLVRFLSGISHAPIFPVQNVSIMHWFPVGNWALPHGLSSTGLTLGVAVTTPILAWMLVEIGWRYAFIVLSPLAFIVALLWWWYGTDDPSEHPAVNDDELNLIRGTGVDNNDDEEQQLPWYEVLKNRNILLLTISYLCMNMVFYEVFSWFFYYLVTIRGFDVQDASYLTSTQWVFGAIGAAAGGWICDRLCRRFGLRWGFRLLPMIGMILSGTCLLAGAYSTNTHLAMVLFILCFLFNQLTEGAFWGTSIAIGGDQAGAASGVMNTGANISGTIGALLVPLSADVLGWSFAIATGSFFALLGAFLWLLIEPDKPLSSQGTPANE